MRAFPGYYRGNSVYAMFPFTVPDQNYEILKRLGQVNEYDFSRPSFIGPPTPIVTWSGVVSVLSNQDQFKVPCELNYKIFFQLVLPVIRIFLKLQGAHIHNI